MQEYTANTDGSLVEQELHAKPKIGRCGSVSLIAEVGRCTRWGTFVGGINILWYRSFKFFQVAVF